MNFAPIAGMLNINPGNTAVVAGSLAMIYVINEQFETGVKPTDGGWNASDGSPNWGYSTSPAPLKGSLSLACGNNTETICSSSVGYSTAEAFCLVNVSSVASLGFIFGFCNSDTSANVCVIGMNSDGTLVLYFNSVSSVNTVGAMTANQTYYLWVSYRAGSGTNAYGSVAFSTNGIRPISGANFVTCSIGDSTALAQYLTCGNYGATEAIFDNVKFAPSQSIPSNP